MKKSLLIVTFSLYSGGAERALVNFLNQLSPEQYDVDLLLFRREGMYIDQIPAWVKLVKPCSVLAGLYWNKHSRDVLRGPVQLFSHYVVFPLSTIICRKLSKDTGNKARQLRWKYVYSRYVPKLRKHYDVAMSYANGEILCYLTDKVDADRKLTWVHNFYPESSMCADIEREYFAKVDGIATISDKCAEALRMLFPESREKVAVIPNIVSGREIRRMAETAEPEDIDTSEPVILSVGRLSRVKRPDIAVEAARILRERGVCFHWYWIGGEGGESAFVNELIHKYGLEDRFIFLGTRINPYIYMKRCTAFVQSSESEGKSLVIDEAKILGRPIVSTDYPTIHDQLKADEGVIVPISPEGLADGLEKLLKNPEQLSRISETLSARKYGNEAVISEYIKWIG